MLEKIIRQLQLEPHPEGGFYKEVYRSDMPVTTDAGLRRCSATSIHYLLSVGQKSNWHRLLHDELWFFHSGAPLAVHSILPAEKSSVVGGEVINELYDGRLHKRTVLHNDLLCSDFSPESALLTMVVPRGIWFAATPCGTEGGQYSMVSCVVAPGFEFADFELAGADSGTDFPEIT
jgi:predicted cupin superfamily sugar epimerase